jgi:hypothetical protein
LAFVVGFILAKHIPRLRSRLRGFARQEDWAIRDEIANEIAGHVRRHFRLEKHPISHGSFDTGPYMAASRSKPKPDPIEEK